METIDKEQVEVFLCILSGIPDEKIREIFHKKDLRDLLLGLDLQNDMMRLSDYMRNNRFSIGQHVTIISTGRTGAVLTIKDGHANVVLDEGQYDDLADQVVTTNVEDLI